MPSRVRASRLRVPNVSEIDFVKLRTGRLARLQAMMKRHGFPVALLFNTANIRYATGVDVMGVWTAGTFARYAILPAEGAPILFEYKGSIHVAQKLVRTSAPPTRGSSAAWTRGTRRGSGRDRSAPCSGSWGSAASASPSTSSTRSAFSRSGRKASAIVDVGPATVDAREVKTPEEIELFKINGGIGDAMLAEFEAAIRPGIREYELLAVLSDALLRRHGEFLFTRLVASGTNTNPWLTEAHDKIVMPGDLVGVDTDANGYEGYVIDVSRTFLCGDVPLPEQREAYRVAYDAVMGMLDLVKPGMAFAEFAQRAPRLPEAYVAQRYPTMVHQAGLEDEGPGIPYPDDDRGPRRIMPDREIKENMVLCLECYAGKVGAPFGVKLEDQVVVTADGAELLCTYPYDAKLLG